MDEIDIQPEAPPPPTGRLPLTIALVVFLLLLACIVPLARMRATHHRHDEMSDMRQELAQLRAALASYQAKHKSGPRALNERVKSGESKKIPNDPVTGSMFTWRAVTEENVGIAADFQSSTAPAKKDAPDIIDIKSGA